MAWQILINSWWVAIFVGAMLYALVTCVLATLASQYRTAISLHDRMRESHEMRQKYIEEVKNRKANH